MSDKTLQKIMYVEDEPDIQAVAKLALETVGGFTVKICSSGKEALEEVHGFGPDLVLLDVMMPDMDGPSTLKELQADDSLKGLPVIFMTAKVQPQEIAQYREMGALDVIPKPFDPMNLANSIREAWSRHVS